MLVIRYIDLFFQSSTFLSTFYRHFIHTKPPSYNRKRSSNVVVVMENLAIAHRIKRALRLSARSACDEEIRRNINLNARRDRLCCPWPKWSEHTTSSMVARTPMIAWLGALRRVYVHRSLWQRLFRSSIILALIFYLALGFYLIFDQPTRIVIIVVIRVDVRCGDAMLYIAKVIVGTLATAAIMGIIIQAKEFNYLGQQSVGQVLTDGTE